MPVVVFSDSAVTGAIGRVGLPDASRPTCCQTGGGVLKSAPGLTSFQTPPARGAAYSTSSVGSLSTCESRASPCGTGTRIGNTPGGRLPVSSVQVAVAELTGWP